MSLKSIISEIKSEIKKHPNNAVGVSLCLVSMFLLYESAFFSATGYLNPIKQMRVVKAHEEKMAQAFLEGIQDEGIGPVFLAGPCAHDRSLLVIQDIPAWPLAEIAEVRYEVVLEYGLQGRRDPLGGIEVAIVQHMGPPLPKKLIRMTALVVIPGRLRIGYLDPVLSVPELGILVLGAGLSNRLPARGRCRIPHDQGHLLGGRES